MPLPLPLAPAVSRPARLFRLSTERRTHPRVAISVGGRFMLEDRSEHGGTTVDASLKSISIRSAASPRVGERVVGYFDTLGRIEGQVERLIDSGFILDLATTPRKRDKLASQLTWLANRDILNLPEDRRHDRIVPRVPGIDVRMLSDRLAAPLRGVIIDVSRSGAGISVNGQFQKGDDLLLGSTPARVIRAFEGGIAVEFRAPVPEAMFSVDIRL